MSSSVLWCYCMFFVMNRRQPRSTLTDTLYAYTTLFRSAHFGIASAQLPPRAGAFCAAGSPRSDPLRLHTRPRRRAGLQRGNTAARQTGVNEMSDIRSAPRNIIFHGDCTRIMEAFDDEAVDFILTDPPYVTRYRDRQGRKVANDDNGRWLKPAFRSEEHTSELQ